MNEVEHEGSVLGEVIGLSDTWEGSLGDWGWEYREEVMTSARVLK